MHTGACGLGWGRLSALKTSDQELLSSRGEAAPGTVICADPRTPVSTLPVRAPRFPGNQQERRTPADRGRAQLDRLELSLTQTLGAGPRAGRGGDVRGGAGPDWCVGWGWGQESSAAAATEPGAGARAGSQAAAEAAGAGAEPRLGPSRAEAEPPRRRRRRAAP